MGSERDRVETKGFAGRTAKYSVLLGLMLVDLFLLLTTFSSYVERRRFDDLLKQTNNGSTYESLYYDLAQYESAVRDIREARCAQRDAIAFYRLSTHHLINSLNRAYQFSLDARGQLYAFVDQHKDVLETEPTKKAIDGSWDLVLNPEKLDFIETVPEDKKQPLRAAFSELQTDIVHQVDTFVRSDSDLQEFLNSEGTKLSFHAASEFSGVASQRQAMIELRTFIFNLSAVAAFESRVEKLQSVVDKLKQNPAFPAFIQQRVADDLAAKGSSIEEAAARLNEALNPSRGALTGSLADLDCTDTNRPMLDAVKLFFDRSVKPELIKDVEQKLATKGLGLAPERPPDSKALAQPAALDAGKVPPQSATEEAIDAAWTQALRPFDNDTIAAEAFPSKQRVTEQTVWGISAQWLGGAGGWIARFGTLPTSIQTLFVTMLFGVAGALCVNGLRLSRRGYWATVDDPRWGEIAISVVLGAFAALIVFLLAAVGLILVSDGQTRSGEFSSVGASLVGLLGFVSGLLNDAAFARIKQFGEGVFGGQTEGSEGAAEGAGQTLARRFMATGCTRFAALTLVHELEPTLESSPTALTLFTPTDAAFDGLSAKDWDALTSTSDTSAFESLRKRLTTGSVFSADQLRRAPSIKMEDGTELKIELLPDATKLKVGQATADLDSRSEWNGSMFYAIDGIPKPGV